MYSLGMTIITIPVSFMVEKDMSAWMLKPDLTLVTILYSGLLGHVFIMILYCCCLYSKGPFYISIFKPLSIVIAAAASFICLGDDLHLGSVVGGMILLLGFYSVLWGKAKEQESTKCGSENLATSTDSRTPLLRSQEKYVE
ncbi:WAT1-related protein [Parasponia andersonii]|uniref:WAT1-related protein n=1 Tax=Parasponia andersonii TaxID=3476 RepID=A0A2P5BF85_PARAD|nr:WAT1-related protein [Parasponia andersonii]